MKANCQISFFISNLISTSILCNGKINKMTNLKSIKFSHLAYFSSTNEYIIMSIPACLKLWVTSKNTPTFGK